MEMQKEEELVVEARRLPRGARFYRCALQVNPYSYAQRHGSQIEFESEAAYNKAMVTACQESGVEAIAVTDHYRIDTSKALIEAARDAGIVVFPGFEAVTKDGVHFLCVFDPGTEPEEIKARIHQCDVHSRTDEESPLGGCDTEELLENSRNWGAICIAAHVASKGGLLRVKSGKARINAWKNPLLKACALPGPVEDAPKGLDRIIANRDHNYRRERKMAVVNANDVDCPEDFNKATTSCWIKMSRPSTEGIRQAFLDAESRISLSDPGAAERTEFVAMTWEGGFLDGTKIHFNRELNVLIGGRGAGKSTIIESLRYVLQLDPLGADAEQVHESIVENVLGSGTKVSLMVRLHRPSQREYVVERVVPNPPTVRDEEENVLEISPADLLPGAEVYGQHEIAELARDNAKLTRLLDRFTEIDAEVKQNKKSLRGNLADVRRRLLETRRKTEEKKEQLQELPVIEETLRQYEEAGLEEKLRLQSKLVREEQVLKTARERLQTVRSLRAQMEEALPLDTGFAASDTLAELPNESLLSDLKRSLDELSSSTAQSVNQIEQAVERAESQVDQVKEVWENQRESAQEKYEATLRELQSSSDIDGEEFIRLRRRVEELRPLQHELKRLEEERDSAQQRRRNLLADWQDAKRKEYHSFEVASRLINENLSGQVRVEVAFEGDRCPLTTLLDSEMEGRRKRIIDALEGRDSLSLTTLSEACQDGAETVKEKYDLTTKQSKKLADLSPEVCMKIEELELPPSTQIELNVAAEGQESKWRPLDALSTGQRATAVLLLLLLESETPLIVDQPEDDLDNRFVTDGVIPAIRDGKGQRQFVLATHNANLPVLGDAELILGLSPRGKAGSGRAEIRESHRGSIDQDSVRHLVEELLEGGKEAFERRRAKYGF